MLKRKLNEVVSFTSWFKTKQGFLNEFELIGCGSACLVNLNVKKFSNVGVLTVGHNVHPFKFPHYFPQKEILNLKNVEAKFAIELRNSIGKSRDVIKNSPFLSIRSLYFHPERDLCLLVPNLSDFDADCVKEQVRVYEITSNVNILKENENLSLYGHFYDDSVGITSDSDYFLIPEMINGQFYCSLKAQESHNLGFYLKRNFIKTEKPSEEGMCGGVVLRKSNDELIGIIDGRFDIPKPINVTQNGAVTPNIHPLSGMTSFTDVSEINDWLNSLNFDLD